MGAPQAINDRSLPNRYRNDRNLRRCTGKKRDNTVLIDVDSDDFGDVIVLDVPESVKRKFRKKPINVISIDDDDGDGCESSDGAFHSNNGASTINRCFPTETSRPSTSAYAAEDSIFGNEGNTPVKLSKSKRTYSRKRISRNQFGLPSDSEGDSSSSESDGSDCELMEGSSGKLRDQWEKASYRKRNGHIGVPPNFDDQAGTSGPSHNFDDIIAEEGTGQDPQPPGEPSKLKNCSMHCADCEFPGYPHESSDGIEDSEQVEDPMEMNGEFTSIPSHPQHDCAGESANLDTKSPSQQSNVRSCSLHHEGDDAFPDYPQKSYGRSKASEQDYDYVEDQCTVKTSEAVEDLGDFVGNLAQQVKLPQQKFDAQMTNERVDGDSSAEVTKGACQDSENDQPALFNSQQSAGVLSLISDLKSSCGKDATSSPDQNGVITDRQKIKETEAYKHAMEEEWAARQEQLLRQAEEARRLRSRKKAENLRIMMNERRQKERLEEMRQARIRDEENLNIKEKYRAEIKKELHKIETICGDMASLLRCLGIHVSGGLFPPPNEVQVAFKKACLKFHPDRISASDLRQQVEAEEKFKLISNMKDKFLSSR